jgi:SpoVK/Ycf46/Vps4 family AAA+-type ATPase
MDNFNEFIDSTKEKKHINYFDFIHVINACNVHYYENRYDVVHFSGIHPKNKKKISKFDSLGKTLHNRSSAFSPVRSYELFPPKLEPAATMHHYDWSGYQEPMYGRSIVVPKPEFEKKPHKIKKQIDFTVDTLDDLLKLIEQHPYSAEYEYNIDLKGLHAIEPELKKLNEMIGIKSLKNSVLNQLIYFLQQPVLGNTNDFKHTIICGPPGTGKTEIAKIMGQMYCKIGVLKKNIFKKVTRNDLVAGYLGQTAMKTKDVINSCLGGCLFLDEAYSLGGGDNTDSFAKECVDTLCEALSDRKEDLMVIVAGYEEDLKNHFFAINRGLESRFIWKFNMEDYSSKEMVEIFEKKVRELEWELVSDLSNKKMVEWIDSKKENFKHFGRDIEIMLSHVKICHARRVYGKPAELLKKITLEDLESGYKHFLENGKKKTQERYCSLYL